MVLSEKALEINTVYQLIIELSSILYKSRQIELNAKCVRIEPDSNLAFYNCGFEFLEIEPENIKKLKELTDKFIIEV